jgi:hypothetical protein
VPFKCLWGLGDCLQYNVIDNNADNSVKVACVTIEQYIFVSGPLTRRSVVLLKKRSSGKKTNYIIELISTQWDNNSFYSKTFT